MRHKIVWKTALGLERTVVEDVDLDDATGALVVCVRPAAHERDRCPYCGGAARAMTLALVVGGGGRWMSGRCSPTSRRTRRGSERCAELELVSCDDAEWITRPVAERCPQAIICLDPFHIVKAATDALDEIRRETWNDARRAGDKQLARELEGARLEGGDADAAFQRAPPLLPVPPPTGSRRCLGMAAWRPY